MIETCPTVSKNEWQRAPPKKRVKKPDAPIRPERTAKRATESAKKSLDWVSSTANYLARSRGQKSVVQPHLTTSEDATNIKVTNEEACTAHETLLKFTKPKRPETLSTADGEGAETFDETSIYTMKRGLDYDLNFNHIINGN
jgi:hypothetical protein